MADIIWQFLSDFLSGICSDKLLDILSSILACFLAYIAIYVLAFCLAFILAFYLAYSDILSGVPSGTCSDILPGSLSSIYSDILSGICSGILSGNFCAILSGIHFDRTSFLKFYLAVLTYYQSAWLPGIYSDILPGMCSVILSDNLSGIQSGIYCVELLLAFFLAFHLADNCFFFWTHVLTNSKQCISIWHVFSQSVSQSFWHSIWHILWHSVWHSFWHSILTFCLEFYDMAFCLAFHLAFCLAFSLAWVWSGPTPQPPELVMTPAPGPLLLSWQCGRGSKRFIQPPELAMWHYIPDARVAHSTVSRVRDMLFASRQRRRKDEEWGSRRRKEGSEENHLLKSRDVHLAGRKTVEKCRDTVNPTLHLFNELVIYSLAHIHAPAARIKDSGESVGHVFLPMILANCSGNFSLAQWNLLLIFVAFVVFHLLMNALLVTAAGWQIPLASRTCEPTTMLWTSDVVCLRFGFWRESHLILWWQSSISFVSGNVSNMARSSCKAPGLSPVSSRLKASLIGG